MRFNGEREIFLEGKSTAGLDELYFGRGNLITFGNDAGKNESFIISLITTLKQSNKNFAIQ
jgi:hypothetical protein